MNSTTEIDKLKANLRRKLITKMDMLEQLKKLPLSDIIDMGRTSLTALQSQETLRLHQIGSTYQHKMKLILSWLKKINPPLDLTNDEKSFFSLLNETEPELFINNIEENEINDDEDQLDSNLTITPRNYDKQTPSTSNTNPTAPPPNQPTNQQTTEPVTHQIIISNAPTIPLLPKYNPIKRKFINFNLHTENLQIEYDTTKKIRKTVYRQEETPIPPQWKPWSPFLMEPIILVKHEQLSPAEIRDNIVKAIETGNLPPVIGTFITSNDALRIKSPDNITRKNNMAKLKEWLPELQILKPRVFDPKIRLIKVKYEGSLTDIDSMRNLVDNIWQTSELKEAGKYVIESAYTSNLINHIDIIITISPSVRDKIHDKRGSLYYLGNEIKVTDYFKVSCCPKCYSYQHREKKCQAQQICKFCSLLHNWRECPINNKPNLYSCINCKNSQQDHQHSADDWNCPCFQKKLREAIQLINYEYRWIIRV